MKPWMLVSLAVLAFGCFGCGDPEDDGPEDSRYVSDYKRELGLDFLRCPVMRTDYSMCDDMGCRCSHSQQDAAQCLADAFASCTPAHLAQREYYGRAGWVAIDYLVVPGGERCKLVRFRDTTHVPRDCNSVSRSTCSSLNRGDGSWGCDLWASGCGDFVEVVADSRKYCSEDWF